MLQGDEERDKRERKPLGGGGNGTLHRVSARTNIGGEWGKKKKNHKVESMRRYEKKQKAQRQSPLKI